MGHHKSNRQVEGDPERDHGRGMPRRPDAEELEKLTEEDRRDVGLPADGPADAAAQYEEAQTAVDRQADSGELPTGTESRKHREDFPPTDYED